VTLTGASGVPATASAVAFKVTALPKGGAAASGFITTYPTGTPRPNTSTINWSAWRWGYVNQVISALGQNGQVNIDVVAGVADVIVDVVGYYDDATPATATGGLYYTPISGSRVVDTRSGFGGIMTTGTERSFQVAGVGGVPANATAVAVNVAAVGQAGFGWVNITPSTDPPNPSQPVLALIGDTDTRSGFAITKLGTDGRVRVWVQPTTHIIIDVVGYYTASATTGAGMQPLIPQRLHDTRDTGTGPVGDLDVAVSDGPGMGAAIINVTLINPSVNSWATVYPANETPPGISNLNFSAGEVLGNTTIARVGADGRVHVKLHGGATAHVIVDLVGYSATASGVSVPNNNLLRNASFELGTATTADNWATNTACGDAANQVAFQRITSGVNAVGGADDGASYARVNATAPGAAGSLCQNVNHQPATGELYRLTFRARSAPGQPAGRGAIELWELGGQGSLFGNYPLSASTQRPLITTSSWADYAVSMCAKNTANYSLRVKLYPYTTTPIDIDNVRLVLVPGACSPEIGELPTAATPPSAPDAGNNFGSPHFDTNSWGVCASQYYRYDPSWTPVGNVRLNLAPVSFGSNGGHLQTSTDNGSIVANRPCHQWTNIPGEGVLTTFSVWVKGRDVPVSGHIELSAWQIKRVNGVELDRFVATATTSFVAATNTWRKVSVSFWGTNTAEGITFYPDTYRAIIKSNTPGAVLLVDEATHTGTLNGNPDIGGGGGGGGGGQQPPPLPTNRLFEDNRVTPLHDPQQTVCLSSSVSTVVPMGIGCVLLIPELVAGGYVLVDRETQQCLTQAGSSLLATECSGSISQLFVDHAIDHAVNSFSIGPASGGCLTRTGSSVSVITCSGAESQRWADLRTPGANAIGLCEIAGAMSLIPSNPNGFDIGVTVAQSGNDIRGEVRIARTGRPPRVRMPVGSTLIATFIDAGCRGLLGSANNGIPDFKIMDKYGYRRWLAHMFLVPAALPSNWYPAQSPYLTACGVTTSPIWDSRYNFLPCEGDPNRRLVLDPR
jgi:hypothetical protein